MKTVSKECKLIIPVKDNIILKEMLKDKYESFMDNTFLDFYRVLLKATGKWSASRSISIPGRSDVKLNLKAYAYNGSWQQVNASIKVTNKAEHCSKTYFIQTVEEAMTKQIEDSLLGFDLKL